MLKNKTENMEIHLVYAGRYYGAEKLRSLIIKGMKTYKIKEVMVTMIYMLRWKLNSKEEMENYCSGKEDAKESVNDDLEILFEDIRFGENLNDNVSIYFLPKLTKEEMYLVERKDHDFMNSFVLGMHSDVDKAVMMLSESDSKFVDARGRRKTFLVENALPENELNPVSLAGPLGGSPEKNRRVSWEQKICSLQ